MYTIEILHLAFKSDVVLQKNILHYSIDNNS